MKRRILVFLFFILVFCGNVIIAKDSLEYLDSSSDGITSDDIVVSSENVINNETKGENIDFTNTDIATNNGNIEQNSNSEDNKNSYGYSYSRGNNEQSNSDSSKKEDAGTTETSSISINNITSSSPTMVSTPSPLLSSSPTIIPNIQTIIPKESTSTTSTPTPSTPTPSSTPTPLSTPTTTPTKFNLKCDSQSENVELCFETKKYGLCREEFEPFYSCCLNVVETIENKEIRNKFHQNVKLFIDQMKKLTSVTSRYDLYKLYIELDYFISELAIDIKLNEFSYFNK